MSRILVRTIDQLIKNTKKKKVMSNQNQKSTGIIKFFNSEKAFGFITPDGGGKDLFVHANNVEGNVKSLREGQRVEFTEGPGRKGPEATNVRVLQ